MMNVIIEDKDLQLLLDGESSKKYKKLAKDVKFMERLGFVRILLENEENVSGLSRYSYLRYEKLRGNLSGFSSIRIMSSRIERLIFTEHEGGITIKLIELNQDHYGNK
ncbi:MAG: hypothetical protein K6F33_03930 [Bacteroidales bacterium]|nr:hypothetical protein [Bacteroidales bacterium]